MNKIIITTTYYPYTVVVRYKLAIEMLEKARSAELPVVVIDGSTDEDVLDGLRGTGAIVHQQQFNGLLEARRQAFFTALCLMHKPLCQDVHPQAILWMEPEKGGLLSEADKLYAPIISGKAQVVMAARTDAGWESLNDYQRESEQAANAVYQEVTGREGFDPMFGPIAFSFDFIRDYLFSDAWLQGTAYAHQLMTMLAPDHDVISVPVDFTYPPEQQEEESSGSLNTKRDQQRRELESAFRAMAQLKS